MLEAKRKILEQAGVYIESASEVKNFDLTKDTITSFAAAVMQVKDTKEDVSFQQGHMTLTLKLTAQVDLAEVRKQLAARQLDAGVRGTVAVQQERLKRLEAQLEAMMQRQQGGQVPGQMSVPSPSDAEYLQMVRKRAAQGDAEAQTTLGVMYMLGFGHDVPVDYAQARQWLKKAVAQGNAEGQYWFGHMYFSGYGVTKDYVKARHWWEKAAAQGFADAQIALGNLYYWGDDVPRDYAMARQWYEKAAAQGSVDAPFPLGSMYYDGEGVPQDDVRAYMWWSVAAAHSAGNTWVQEQAVKSRDKVALRMTPTQITEAQRLAQQCQAQQFKGC